MKHLFTSYELAKIAKEKGFNERCLMYWIKYPDKVAYLCDLELHRIRNIEEISDNDILAPLYQQVQDWLREKHNIHIEIEYMDEVLQYNCVVTEILTNTKHQDVNWKLTYYDALDKAIEQALTLIP